MCFSVLLSVLIYSFPLSKLGAPVYILPACRRLLFPLLHAEKGRRPFSACNKGNRRRLHAGKYIYV